MSQEKPISHKKLALIHILKKELGLSDRAYRDQLQRVTGARSAKDLTEAQFQLLMKAFVRSKYYRDHPLGLTLRQKLFIEYLLGRLAWDSEHIRNFFEKYYHRQDLAAFTRIEASKVIEALKNILKQKLARDHAEHPPPGV
jgi:hypothetical protein